MPAPTGSYAHDQQAARKPSGSCRSLNIRPQACADTGPRARYSPQATRIENIDFFVVGANTEGEYSSIGGRIFSGTEREVVVQETVMTRIGVNRILLRTA